MTAVQYCNASDFGIALLSMSMALPPWKYLTLKKVDYDIFQHCRW